MKFGSKPEPTLEEDVLEQDFFRRLISVERKRSERSGRPFLLMLLAIGTGHSSNRDTTNLADVRLILSRTVRETDTIGWYDKRTVLGILFTEISKEDRKTIRGAMLVKVSSVLREHLTSEQFRQISISFHLFPDDWDHERPGRPNNPALYPDLMMENDGKQMLRVVKRGIDIVGGAICVLLCLPLFIIIGLLIKLTSKGPVFYRQRRFGQHGVPFVFLKFRSMYVDNDPSTHKEYVKQMIYGSADPRNGNGAPVYKLTADPRVTRIGALLRKSSFDELPQLFNVLKGEMSLVGPRPPILYEVEAYKVWHRRRILEAKPGMTGLWQVNGRNRLGFDEMVRLDLAYSKAWSPWLDIKILLRTPRAVLEGAY